MIFKKDKWYVYFFRSGKTDYFKIGYSKNPYQRWIDLQVGNPYLLHKVGYIELPTEFVAKKIEQKLHKVLTKKGKHVLGEWFYLKGMDMPSIIKSAGSSPDSFIKGEDVVGTSNNSEKKINKKLNIRVQQLEKEKEKLLEQIAELQDKLLISNL